MKRLISAALLSACSAALAAVATGEGEGTVIELDPGGHSLLIEHGKIGDIMDPMTMPFTVDEPKLLNGVHVGDRVKFTLEWRQPDEFIITQMSVIKPAGSP